MARLTKVDLESLRDHLLGAMPDTVREVTAALRFTELAPPATPQAQELLDAVEQVAARLHLELRAYERVFDSDRFQGRIFVYEKEQKGSKPAWTPTEMEYAGSRVMGGEAEQLRSLAEHLLRDADEHSIALWLTSAPAPTGVNLYFLYARHQAGDEACFVLRHGKLHRLPIEGQQLDTLLGLVAPALSLERGYWKRVLQSLGELATSELRSEVAKFLEEELKTDLSDERWKQLLKHFYMNLDFLRFQMEVGRSVATPVLQEAQVLLTSLVEGLERASKMFDERLEQARRDHRRELKRRTSDYDKLDLAYKGLQRRAQRQADELSELQRRTPRVGGPTGPSHSLGQTLRLFF